VILQGVAMPTVESNRNWSKDLDQFTRFRDKKIHYGDQWGDTEVTGLRYWIQRIGLRRTGRFSVGRVIPGNLSHVVKNYIEPYVTPQSVVVEIGPGGGRWTKYLLAAKEIILVELNPEFFPYLQERFKENLSKFRFYNTSGCELDGIDTDSVDFIFTFGTFVHIDPDDIHSYLGHIKRVLKPNAIAVIHYSDMTKKRAQKMQGGFSDMDPSKMEAFSFQYGFRFIDHNTRLLNHSSIAVIQKSQ